MLDISAAFDVMDHGILLNKLELYGLMKMLSTGWVTSQGGHKLFILMDPFPPSYQLMLVSLKDPSWGLCAMSSLPMISLRQSLTLTVMFTGTT